MKITQKQLTKLIRETIDDDLEERFSNAVQALEDLFKALPLATNEYRVVRKAYDDIIGFQLSAKRQEDINKKETYDDDIGAR